MARLAAGEPPRVVGRRIEIEGLRADGEVFPLELAIANSERVASAVDLPVTVDFEGGYAAGGDRLPGDRRLTKVRRLFRRPHTINVNGTVSWMTKHWWFWNRLNIAGLKGPGGYTCKLA